MPVKISLVKIEVFANSTFDFTVKAETVYEVKINSLFKQKVALLMQGPL
jgi:hypothetical protein